MVWNSSQVLTFQVNTLQNCIKLGKNLMDFNFQKGFISTYINQVLALKKQLLDDKKLQVKVNTISKMPTEGFRLDWHIFTSIFGNQMLSAIKNAAKDTTIIVSISFEDKQSGKSITSFRSGDQS
jgi:hypothetical protein